MLLHVHKILVKYELKNNYVHLVINASRWYFFTWFGELGRICVSSDREGRVIPQNVLEYRIPFIDSFVYKLCKVSANRNAISSRIMNHDMYTQFQIKTQYRNIKLKAIITT